MSLIQELRHNGHSAQFTMSETEKNAEGQNYNENYAQKSEIITNSPHNQDLVEKAVNYP